MQTLFAPEALLPEGWGLNVRVTLDAGRIVSVEPGAQPAAGDTVLTGRALLPAMPNLHSHTFQRAMAGMTERRGPGEDSFWTWRQLMYRFLDVLSPEDIEAIAALTFIEMLEAGYASVAEFHYLHHQPGGTPYDAPAELSLRIVQAAADAGIGLTLLPVLYSYGGAGAQPLAGGQLRFGNDLDGFLAPARRRRHGAHRRRGDRRRPAFAPRDHPRPDRGAGRRTARTGRCTSTPPSRSRRWRRSPAGSARTPWSSCSTRSASTRAGA